MNKWLVTGRLVTDVERRQTTSGVVCAHFRIAVNRYVKGQQLSDFYSIVAWRTSAEFALAHFHKGSAVELECHLSQEPYTDKDGKTQRPTIYTADSIGFPVTNRTVEPPEVMVDGETKRAEEFTEVSLDDDLPF